MAAIRAWKIKHKVDKPTGFIGMIITFVGNYDSSYNEKNNERHDNSRNRK